MKTALSTLVTNVATLLTAGKAAARDLHAALADLLGELGARHGDRARLVNVLPTVPVLERAIVEEVDALAARGRTTYCLPLARAVAGRLDLAPDHTIRGLVPGSIATWLAWPIDFPTLCWLVPDAVKASLMGTVKA